MELKESGIRNYPICLSEPRDRQPEWFNKREYIAQILNELFGNDSNRYMVALTTGNIYFKTKQDALMFKLHFSSGLHNDRL